MWKRLAENFPDLGILAGCGLFAGILRTIFVPGIRDLRAYLVTLFVCVPVAIMGGGLAIEHGVGDFATICVAVLISLAAQGIIEVALDSRKYIVRIVENLIQKYTGETSDDSK